MNPVPQPHRHAEEEALPAVDEQLQRELERWLGEASFDTLIAQCWEDADQALQDLAESERISARDKMRAAAHKLKGLALSFGYPQLAGLAGRLESACQFASGSVPPVEPLRLAAARARTSRDPSAA
jgi:HPt (histidine-containing phosphotransfer) domain-containing protein